nr:MAG TPA: hypothetical protein [Caudoviricetes sp.]
MPRRPCHKAVGLPPDAFIPCRLAYHYGTLGR